MRSNSSTWFESVTRPSPYSVTSSPATASNRRTSPARSDTTSRTPSSCLATRRSSCNSVIRFPPNAAEPLPDESKYTLRHAASRVVRLHGTVRSVGQGFQAGALFRGLEARTLASARRHATGGPRHRNHRAGSTPPLDRQHRHGAFYAGSYPVLPTTALAPEAEVPAAGKVGHPAPDHALGSSWRTRSHRGSRGGARVDGRPTSCRPLSQHRARVPGVGPAIPPRRRTPVPGDRHHGARGTRLPAIHDCPAPPMARRNTGVDPPAR